MAKVGFGGEKCAFSSLTQHENYQSNLIVCAPRSLFQDGPDDHNIDNVPDADGAGAHVRVLLDGSPGRRL